MSKVGILIKKFESQFSNGCVQQSYFLLKQIRLGGFDVELVGLDPNYRNFEFGNEKVKCLRMDEDLSVYGVLLCVSGLNSEVMFQEKLKRENVKVINVICGNYFILHHEEVVFNVHNIILTTRNEIYRKYVTENWVLPMYNWTTDYVTLLTGVPTISTPYVWDTDCIDDYINERKLNVKFRPEIYDKDSKLMIFIFEPNMSIHKTSLIPLLACDEYYRKNPSKIGNVYHFCTNNNNAFTNFATSLKLHKDGKINYMQRMIMPSVISQVINNKNNIPIVLTNNFHNELNFLHLELMYFGVPVIHNCTPYEELGLYYKTETCSNILLFFDELYKNYTNSNIEERRKYHLNYMTNGKKILDFYSPNNQSHIDEYTKQLRRYIPQTSETNVSNKKNICICLPLEKSPWFAEIVTPLYESLKDLKFNTTLLIEPTDTIEQEFKKNKNCLYIIYCIERFNTIPNDFIVYQFEHLLPRIDSQSNEITLFVKNLRLAKRVWDFSYINNRFYDKYNIKNYVTVPFGYHPCMTLKSQEPNKYKNLSDKVILMGNFMTNTRRYNVWTELIKNCDINNKVVMFNNNAWNNQDHRVGKITYEKTNIIHNATCLLNIKMFSPELMSQETPRILYALANNCHVITEKSLDTKIEQLLSKGLVIVSNINEMKEMCMKKYEKGDFITWLKSDLDYRRFIPVLDLVKT